MIKKENDFGFTLEDENSMTKIEIVDNKAKEIWKIMEPFLNNLMKNPEKDIIKWPGATRIAVIQDVKDRITKILED